jgi:hypothetical protein
MIRQIALFTVLAVCFSCTRPGNELPLKGKWDLCLDSTTVPETVSPDQLDFTMKVSLPGTLDEAGIGDPVKADTLLRREAMLHLQRKVSYIGPAYYRREVVIPSGWKGRNVSMLLERVIWESTVWVDGKRAGSSSSLSTPHEYDLTGLLTPGRHTLVICIDNSRQHTLSRGDMAHAYTEETQIRWNGILGEFSLKACSNDRIGNVAVYPYYAGKSISGKIGTTGSMAGKALKITVLNNRDSVIATAAFPVEGPNTGFRFDLPSALKPWSEFSPELYHLSVSLMDGDSGVLDSRLETFGFRDVEARGRHLFLNGERLFLRGTLECCIFPLTGHPPLDEAGWEKVFTAAREYGLNHLRFHSWCPPEAAFAVADRLGFMLQVELPNWSLDFGSNAALVDYMNNEADRILECYGNHPSFLMMSMGNELEGDYALLNGLVTRLRNEDPRHLYTTTTYTFQKGHGLFPEAVDDFFVTQNTEKGWIRGQGVFDQQPPEFMTDYGRAMDHIGIPVISHEIGQYSVFPGMSEIDKYTGVLVPNNLKAIRKDMADKGFEAGTAAKYSAATGRFATLLYKEEIERALKTDGLSGFQLLDLHDFPGQGTALVGILDAFWESKGFTGGSEWRMFCSEVVPLLWFDKAVYTVNESFTASFGVANHFRDLTDSKVRWTMRGSNGKAFAGDSVLCGTILKGSTARLGQLTIPLGGLPVPARYTITVEIAGTSYKNEWDIWVYSAESKEPATPVVVTASFTEALAALEKGSLVLLNPDPAEINGITGKFVPVFWSPVHFPNQPGTMGLLIDPAHPAFTLFPTDFHSDWQWWDLCKNSKTIVTDSLAVDPIITVIDNFFKNRRLGNLFEAKAGKGKMVFSSIDLHTGLESRPVARQLRESLLSYMNSPAFNPKSNLSSGQLLSLRSVGDAR